MPMFTTTEEELIRLFDYIPAERDNEIIQQNNVVSVSIRDITKLKPGVWLNNNLVNYFTFLLGNKDADICDRHPTMRRSIFFTTYLISLLMNDGYHRVRSWGRKVDSGNIFNLKKIFLPVNVDGCHWSLIVVYIIENKIVYYDSLNKDGSVYLEAAMDYLRKESQQINQDDINENEWSLHRDTNIPQQRNSDDCGVCLCINADRLSQGLPLNYSGNLITLF